MNRFTQYCVERHGFKTDDMRPYLPYEVSPGIVLETTVFNAAERTVKEYYNIGTGVTVIGRDGEVESTDFL